MSSPGAVFRKSITDHWRTTLLWALALTAVCCLYLSLYPSIGSNGQMQEFTKQLPPSMVKTLGFENITTGAGWAQSSALGLLGYVLISIAAVMWGAKSIGGDEESGALELTLAHAVSRIQVVLERGLGLMVRLGFIALVVFTVVSLWNDPAGLEITAENLAGFLFNWWTLAVFAGSVALLGGTVFKRASYGSGIGVLVVAGSYIANAIGNQREEWDWLHSFSPYSWVFQNQPLANGSDLAVGWGLLGISALLVAIAALALRRRDVGV